MTDERFEQIYKDTYNYVLKYIISNCANMQDVNDIIQDTYVGFYTSCKKGKKINNYYSYLIGIADKKIKDYYRARYKRRFLFFPTIIKDNEEKEKELINLIPSDYNLEKKLFEKWELDNFMKFLLKQKQAIIKTFYFYFYFNMTMKEISKELNINESTIKSYIYRTLNSYRDIQKGEHDV